MELKREELMDFMRWLKKKGLLPIDIHGSVIDAYIASINSSSSSEARTLPTNEDKEKKNKCQVDCFSIEGCPYLLDDETECKY